MDRAVSLARDLGLTVDELAGLTARMTGDFHPDTWGYEQLGALGDPHLQAIVSAHLLAASEDVLTNLLEARVAEIDYNELTADGVEYTADFTALDVRESSHIVSFFRAFGSTLDCLAGVAIGVLRIPRPIIKASMSRDLFGLDPSSARDDPTANAWRLFRLRLDELRAGPPASWMDWALLCRHALIHRPRQINMMLPRPLTTRIILPEANMHELLRYDMYLRRRPWLPDLDHLAADRPVEDLYLGEPATQTIRGLMERLNEAVEALAQELHQAWDAQGSGSLTLATPSWSLDSEPDIEFSGFAPDPARSGTEIRAHPQTVMRLQLAERLRRLDR